MLKRYNFYCKTYNLNKKWSHANGGGIAHQYELQQNGQVVFDAATGLWWQQSGSRDKMTFSKTKRFADELCKNKFAGFSDWRLPTLEEAMSLMEKENMNGDLHIDPVFDKAQSWIWTSDNSSAVYV